jgi:hypothetical protein
VPVVAERLGHLVEAEHYDENGEHDGNTERATPGVKGLKEKTQQESHRNHLPGSRPAQKVRREAFGTLDRVPSSVVQVAAGF